MVNLSKLLWHFSLHCWSQSQIHHWKPGVVMMLTLSSLVTLAPQVPIYQQRPAPQMTTKLKSWVFSDNTQGLYSLSSWMSYCKISWSLEATKLDNIYNDRIAPKFDRHFGSSADKLPVKLQINLENFKTESPSFKTLQDLASVRLVNRGLVLNFRDS